MWDVGCWMFVSLVSAVQITRLASQGLLSTALSSRGGEGERLVRGSRPAVACQAQRGRAHSGGAGRMRVYCSYRSCCRLPTRRAACHVVVGRELGDGGIAAGCPGDEQPRLPCGQGAPAASARVSQAECGIHCSFQRQLQSARRPKGGGRKAMSCSSSMPDVMPLQMPPGGLGAPAS
jgi:hypothetical protein